MHCVGRLIKIRFEVYYTWSSLLLWETSSTFYLLQEIVVFFKKANYSSARSLFFLKPCSDLKYLKVIGFI